MGRAAEVPALSLAWIDTLGLIVIGVMLLLGAFRGLWWQVIRLAGLAGAVVLARTLSPELSPRLAEAVPDLPPRFVFGTVWLVVFLAGLAAAAFLGHVGRRLLTGMKLGLVDRATGAAVGVLTGALIHVAFVAATSQLAPEAWVARNVGGSYSETALGVVGARWSLIVGSDAALELERVLGGTMPRSSEADPDAASESN